MTATTTAPRPQSGLLPLFAGILRSEGRKLATVRSTFWALLAVVVFNVATAALLTARGATVTRQGGDSLAVTGSTPEAIGELAQAEGLTLTGLTADQATLEDRYMELTRAAADYRAAPGEPATTRK